MIVNSGNVKALFIYRDMDSKMEAIREWVEDNPNWEYSPSKDVLQSRCGSWMLHTIIANEDGSLEIANTVGRTYDVAVLKGRAVISKESYELVESRLVSRGSCKSFPVLKELVRPEDKVMFASILGWE